jgi:glycosyltransferase involved in cell wall biosynthesis
LTVVTPSFNQAEFLEETIHSVLLQHYPNLEYIIMDGGSTDGSVDIIRKYESKLPSWVSEPDRGQSHAINKGWARATGDIIAYLNSDDYYLPGAIHASVRYLIDHPNIDVVYASVIHVDERGREISRVRPLRFTVPRLVRSCFIAQPSVFLRRSVYERLGPLNESIHHSFDYEYWLRASAIASFGLLPNVSAGVRYHRTSKSSSQLVRFFLDEVAIFDELFANGTLDRNDASLVTTAYLRRLLYIAGMHSGASDAQRASAISRLREMNPRPSRRQITDVIAGHDAYLRSDYVSPESSARASISRYPFVDAAGIIPVLSQMDIVEPEGIGKISSHVRLSASIVEKGRDPGYSLWKLLASAIWSMIRQPDLWFYRSWWVALGRSPRAWRVPSAIAQMARITNSLPAVKWPARK